MPKGGQKTSPGSRGVGPPPPTSKAMRKTSFRGVSCPRVDESSLLVQDTPITQPRAIAPVPRESTIAHWTGCTAECWRNGLGATECVSLFYQSALHGSTVFPGWCLYSFRDGDTETRGTVCAVERGASGNEWRMISAFGARRAFDAVSWRAPVPRESTAALWDIMSGAILVQCTSRGERDQPPLPIALLGVQ